MKKLSRKDERIVVLFVVIGIIVAIYYLMVIPFKDNFKKLNEDKKLAQKEYENIIIVDEKTELFQENLDKLLESVEEKKALLPEKIDELDMVDKATKLKKLLPKGITKCEIIGKEKVESACRNKIKVSFAATYGEIEGLIDKIGGLEDKTSIDNIDFIISSEKLVGTMDVYFYSKE